MRKYGISQLPVTDHGKFVGSVDDTHLLKNLLADPSTRDNRVEAYMQPPFPIVQASDPISSIAQKMSDDVGAVLVELGQ